MKEQLTLRPRMKKIPAYFVVLATLVVAPMASSQVQPYDDYGRPNPDAFEWTGFSLGVSAGTLGLGLDANVHLLSWLNLRASAHTFSLTYKDTIDRIDYDFDIGFSGLALLLDIYPGQMNEFRISAGLAFNDHIVDIDGFDPGTREVTLNGKAEYDSVAPYFGIGWGNPVQPDSALTFTVDLGVLLQDYETSLPAEMPQTTKEDIEDVLDFFTIYPVLTFALHYHF